MLSSKRFAFLLAGVSFVGFLDAAYLSFEHFRGGVPICGTLQGCDVVTSSQYAVFLGIPIAYVGVLYYIAVFVLAVGYIDVPNERLLKAAALLSFAGILASGALVYIQLFVLQAICLYCMGSALTSGLMAAGSAYWWYTRPRVERQVSG